MTEKLNNKPALQGMGASAGEATGPVYLYNPADDIDSLAESFVLVTQITDPTMVFAMEKASAIVTDIGGLASHPAILSRELGIPCVVATGTATSILKTGDIVTVNGTDGTVYVISTNHDEA